MSVVASMRFEARGPIEAGDAGQRLFARAPAGDLEAERAELGRRVLAQDAEAEHADLDVACLRLIVVVRPDALALLALVAAQLAQVRERMHDHPFAHAVGEIGIDHADDRAIRQGGIGEKMIDARAEREDRFEVRKASKRARRMAPGKRITDRGAVERLVQRHDAVRGQKRREPLAPGRQVPAGHGEKNAHWEAVLSLSASAGDANQPRRVHRYKYLLTLALAAHEFFALWATAAAHWSGESEAPANLRSRDDGADSELIAVSTHCSHTTKTRREFMKVLLATLALGILPFVASSQSVNAQDAPNFFKAVAPRTAWVRRCRNTAQ